MGEDRSAETKRQVLIVDDHPLVRAGFAALIGAEPDLEVCSEAGSIGEALAELAECVRTTSYIDCRFAGAPSIKVQDDVAAKHLYRIAQEAVHNALRHGKPRSILIRLDSDDRGLILTITDDGTGMREARGRSGGLGMHIMHYRAGIIAGQITVEPGPDGGTRVRCLVPAPR